MSSARVRSRTDPSKAQGFHSGPRSGLRAPGKMIVAERMILPAWFDNSRRRFLLCYVEGQFKTFRPSAENVNETPESTAKLLQNRVSNK